MKIGIPRESLSGETRVACTPATVALLGKLGFETVVESGAGLAASLDDAAYQTAGATVADKAAVWVCPLIYKVNAPSEQELPLLNEGQTIVSFLWPRQNEALVEALRAKKVNALAMDMVPRISRAQALDALSSMANISGYRAVIEAANAFGRFFTGQITAAGKSALNRYGVAPPRPDLNLTHDTYKQPEKGFRDENRYPTRVIIRRNPRRLYARHRRPAGQTGL